MLGIVQLHCYILDCSGLGVMLASLRGQNQVYMVVVTVVGYEHPDFLVRRKWVDLSYYACLSSL